MHKLKGSSQETLGFVPQPFQSTQTMSGCPILLALRSHKTFGVTPAAVDTGPQGPQLVESAGGQFISSVEHQCGTRFDPMTPYASGAQADELTTSSWPVLPRG